MIHTLSNRVVNIIALTILLSACAHQGGSLPEVSERALVKKETLRQVKLGRVVEKPLSLIAEDLVSALSQIQQVQAGGFVVRVPDARTRFDLAVERSLIKNGFIIKNSNFATNGNLLTTAVNRKPETNEYTHALALDQFALKRSYSINGKMVAPISSLFVRGASPTEIQLDDRVFVQNQSGLLGAETGKTNALRVAAKPFLCTPEGKGRGTDGWVCKEGVSGKQWIDSHQHIALLDAGLEVSAFDWDRLMALPDVEIMTEQEMLATAGTPIPQFQAGSLYLCTPDGKGDGTDGWLCRVGESGKQWLSSAERAKLLRSGIPERRVGWDPLMAMADREFIR